MNKAKIAVSAFLLIFAVHASAMAADQDAGPDRMPSRPKTLVATPPVHLNLTSSGTLVKGLFYVALNPGFSDKTSSKNGYKGSDVFSQAWLLKLRYGITNYLEVNSVLSYVNLTRTNPTPKQKHLEGYGDQSLGLTYALYNIHQRDPISLSFALGVLLPTAPQGANHLPGNAAWGGRASIDFGKFLTRDLKFDTGLVITGPFERGNQDVKRGAAYQWNAQFRYLFTNFDIALESSLVETLSSDKSGVAGKTSLKNGSTEWFVGPSINYAIDRYNLWFGIGIFFPVVQNFDSPTKAEDYQLTFKIGKVW